MTDLTKAPSDMDGKDANSFLFNTHKGGIVTTVLTDLDHDVAVAVTPSLITPTASCEDGSSTILAPISSLNRHHECNNFRRPKDRKDNSFIAVTPPSTRHSSENVQYPASDEAIVALERLEEGIKIVKRLLERSLVDDDDDITVLSQEDAQRDRDLISAISNQLVGVLGSTLLGVWNATNRVREHIQLQGEENALLLQELQQTKQLCLDAHGRAERADKLNCRLYREKQSLVSEVRRLQTDRKVLVKECKALRKAAKVTRELESRRLLEEHESVLKAASRTSTVTTATTEQEEERDELFDPALAGVIERRKETIVVSPTTTLSDMTVLMDGNGRVSPLSEKGVEERDCNPVTAADETKVEKKKEYPPPTLMGFFSRFSLISHDPGNDPQIRTVPTHNIPGPEKGNRNRECTVRSTAIGDFGDDEVDNETIILTNDLALMEEEMSTACSQSKDHPMDESNDKIGAIFLDDNHSSSESSKCASSSESSRMKPLQSNKSPDVKSDTSSKQTNSTEKGGNPECESTYSTKTSETSFTFDRTYRVAIPGTSKPLGDSQSLTCSLCIDCNDVDHKATQATTAAAHNAMKTRRVLPLYCRHSSLLFLFVIVLQLTWIQSFVVVTDRPFMSSTHLQVSPNTISHSHHCRKCTSLFVETRNNKGESSNTLDDRAQRIMYNQQARQRAALRYQIIAAEACEPLATRMAQQYPDRFTFHPTNWSKFPDGTDNIEIGGFTPVNLISGERVLFLASFHNNDVTLSQFQVMICLLQSFIESLTVVLPFSPVGTMERVIREGQVATAATYAHMFSSLPTCGRPTRLMVYDLHTLQNRFYLHGNAVASLHSAIPMLKDKMKAANINCVAFPDDGAAKRFSKMFEDMPGLEIIVCGKTRGEGDTRIVTIQDGNATDKHIVIVDDLVQTGGTLYETGKVLKDAGSASVNAFVTHGVFPNESWKLFNKGGSRACFDKFWVTNSIPTVTDTLPTEDGTFEVLDLMDLIICDLDHFSCS